MAEVTLKQKIKTRPNFNVKAFSGDDNIDVSQLMSGIELSKYESCDSALHYPSSLSTLVGFDLLNCTTFCIDQLMEKTMASRDNTVL